MVQVLWKMSKIKAKVTGKESSHFSIPFWNCRIRVDYTGFPAHSLTAVFTIWYGDFENRRKSRMKDGNNWLFSSSLSSVLRMCNQNDGREKYLIVITAVRYLTGIFQCLGLMAMIDLKLVSVNLDLKFWP